MNDEPQVFRRLNSVLVESIFWDDRHDEVAWVDITAGTFHRAHLGDPVDGSRDRVVELPAPVSAVQPARGGGYVAALKDRIVTLDGDGAIVATLAEIEHAHAGIRFNEGKVDPFGRFIVGGMNMTSGEPDAALYAFAEGDEPRLLRGGFGVANGFEWSGDGREMYVTDTSTKTVYRAPYGPARGELGEFEPYLRGYDSDGLVRDEDGCFWNAVYGAGEVLRWSRDGEVTMTLRVPAPNLTSVAVGGPDRRTLFVGSARENLTESDLAAAPLSGSLFTFDLDVAGRPVGVFGEASASI
ncbi:SMP-30/gluconolactonase/LRE family protein [Microbacterium sp. P07]|uniref:SMP-30/gluconolactonase/LRE family protein n=1 Tax=Microbacterium sp. P07 TaxID=3366952 RepID=UPI003746FCFD